MTFLCMDTGGAYGVLALAEEDSGLLRAVLVFEGRRTLSRRLLAEVDSLLQSNGMTQDDITAFVVGVGPGSFTGVRVGVTTARTLAQVTGKPLVGIGTLDAYAAASALDGEAILVPVLPSRKEEVYAAVYERGVRTDGPFAASPAALTEWMAHREVTLCGDTRTVPGWLGRTAHQPWTPPDGMAFLAARRLRDGDTDDPLGLLPLYVVAPSISTPKSGRIHPTLPALALVSEEAERASGVSPADFPAAEAERAGAEGPSSAAKRQADETGRFQADETGRFPHREGGPALGAGGPDQ